MLRFEVAETVRVAIVFARLGQRLEGGRSESDDDDDENQSSSLTCPVDSIERGRFDSIDLVFARPRVKNFCFPSDFLLVDGAGTTLAATDGVGTRAGDGVGIFARMMTVSGIGVLGNEGETA